jgi:hypothetical protein
MSLGLAGRLYYSQSPVSSPSEAHLTLALSSYVSPLDSRNVVIFVTQSKLFGAILESQAFCRLVGETRRLKSEVYSSSSKFES